MCSLHRMYIANFACLLCFLSHTFLVLAVMCFLVQNSLELPLANLLLLSLAQVILTWKAITARTTIPEYIYIGIHCIYIYVCVGLQRPLREACKLPKLGKSQGRGCTSRAFIIRAQAPESCVSSHYKLKGRSFHACQYIFGQIRPQFFHVQNARDARSRSALLHHKLGI